MDTDSEQEDGAVGQPEPGSKSRRAGRRPLLDAGDLLALRERVTEHSGTSSIELVELVKARGKVVCSATITKALREMGFRKAKRLRPPSEPSPQTPPRYKAEHRREPGASTYPSSLTDAEWDVIAPVLLAARDPRGCKPKHDPRKMMDAVFYLVRSGCQWRLLPKDFPPWAAVWSLFRRLRDSGALERLYDAMFALWRKAADRAPMPTGGIVDSQTVKTTEKGGLVVTTRARRSRAARGTWSLT